MINRTATTLTLIFVTLVIALWYVKSFKKDIAEPHTVYLDNNATTSIHPRALQTMNRCYHEYSANPSALYQSGIKARNMLHSCRMTIAGIIGIKSNELYFTSGATESNNILIRGIYAKHKNKRVHIITTCIEHASVEKTIKDIDVDVTYLKVDKHGLISLHELERAFRTNTILVSVICGNNEIGSIQDVQKIGELCKQRNIHFHSDMTQYIGKYRVDLKVMNVDSASFSSHKFNGPRGVGALYIDENSLVASCITGGGQELGFRSGTENLPGIAGMSVALQEAMIRIDNGSQFSIQQLRDDLKERMKQTFKDRLIINNHPERCLYNTLSVCIRGIDSRNLLKILDDDGIAVSTGSACSKGSGSSVLKALGLSDQDVIGSIRISLSYQTTENDIDRFMISVAKAVAKISV